MIYQHERDEQNERPRAQSTRGLSVYPAPYWGALTKMHMYLKNRGLDPDLALFNGWYPSREAGDGHLRVVIPCAPASDRFWQARAIYSDVEPRYQSPHAPRGSSIVAVFPNPAPGQVGAVCEGPMDALAAAECGLLGLALMGNEPPDACFDYIAQTWAGMTLLIVPDNDSIGTGAVWKMRLEARGHTTRLVLVGGGKDLAALSLARRKEILQ